MQARFKETQCRRLKRTFAHQNFPLALSPSSELLISCRSLASNVIDAAENGGGTIVAAQLGSRANGPAQFQPRVRDPGVKESQKLRAEGPLHLAALQPVPLVRAFSPQISMCIQPRAASPGLVIGDRAFSPRAILYHQIFREIKSSDLPGGVCRDYVEPGYGHWNLGYPENRTSVRISFSM